MHFSDFNRLFSPTHFHLITVMIIFTSKFISFSVYLQSLQMTSIAIRKNLIVHPFPFHSVRKFRGREAKGVTVSDYHGLLLSKPMVFLLAHTLCRNNNLPELNYFLNKGRNTEQRSKFLLQFSRILLDMLKP